MKVIVASLFLFLGTVLLPAVTEDIPVQCPNWKLSCQDDTIENICGTDQDCSGEEKCCDVCGKKCFDPSTLEALIRCPVLLEVLLEGHVLLESCETNKDCDPDQNCCYQCGRKMCSVSDMKVMVAALSLLLGTALLPAVTTDKPGYCIVLGGLSVDIRSQTAPAPGEETSIRKVCKKDEDCAGALKCCPLLMSICAAPEIDETTIVNDCDKDEDCPRAQKCLYQFKKICDIPVFKDLDIY